MRVIRYKLDDPQRVGHDQEHVLLTNLLDEKAFPAAELICGYHERWEHELVYDEQKTHLDPRRATKPTHLRSETPAGVIQEVYALSLGHFVVRALMFQAAQQERSRSRSAFVYGVLPYSAVPLVRMRRADATVLSTMVRIIALGTCPRTHRAAAQPDQSSGYQTEDVEMARRNAPQHRHPPRLTKTFAESVVMVT